MKLGAGTASLDGLQVLWRQMPKGRGGQFGAQIAFSPNEWVRDANESHYRYFFVSMLALAIAASLLLCSFVRESGS